MADIGTIVQEQSYRGDAGLSGTGGAILVDTKPVEDLARYTMFYNKAEYDQRQKDIDAKIAELADYTALDLNAARAKDRDLILKEDEEVRKAGEEFARYTPTSQRDKVEKTLAFKKKVAGLRNNLGSANKRTIAYGVRLNNINSDTTISAELKKKKIDDLNNQFDTTQITEMLPAEDAFSATIAPIPKAPMAKFDVVKKIPGNNQILKITNGLIDMSKARALASSFELGLNAEVLPANPTDSQRREFEQRQDALKKGGNLVYKQATDFLNQAASDAKYQKDGAIDFKAIASSNKLASDAYAMIDQYNQYAADMTQKIDNGEFYDSLGLSPISKTLNKNDYLQIDKTKPITTEQLLLAQMVASSLSDSNSKEIINTNDGIELERIKSAERIAARGQEGENYRAALDLMAKGWKKDGKGGWVAPTATTKGAQILIDESAAFADSVISKISAATDKDGNVDLEKAQLTPIEWQQMGYGQIDEITGKFNLTALAPTALKFDKVTQRIMIPAEETDKNNIKNKVKGFFGFDTDKVQKEVKYVDYKQIANNKFHFSNSITSGKEGEERRNISTGYDNQISPATLPITPLQTDVPLTDAQKYLNSLKK